MALHIGFVASSRTFGGAEFYLALLLGHLAGRAECVLIGVGDLPAGLVSAAERLGVRVVMAPAVRSKLDVGNQLRLLRTLRGAGIDVAHVNLSTATNNRWAVGAAILTRTPVVATLHLRHDVDSRRQRRLLRLAFRRIGAAIAVSEEVADQLTHQLGVPPERVRVVHNGVDAASIASLSATSGTQPSNGQPVRVVAVGRLTRQKGFDVLIGAARRLVDSGCPPFEVVIAGEGRERAALEAAAEGLPVRFAGEVDVRPFLLDGADVFCLPSRWEGLPFVLLDAMMCGLPSVVADTGDIRVAVGDAAMVVEPEDEAALAGVLGRLIGDGAERRRLGQAARARAEERFTAERMVAETFEVYEQVLARR